MLRWLFRRRQERAREVWWRPAGPIVDITPSRLHLRPERND